MTTISSMLEVGKRALLAHQAALGTIAHNLANSATPGYTRQRAELVPTAPLNGVAVASIQRIRDRFLDLALLDATGKLGSAETGAGLLTRLQVVFNAGPEAGLAAALDGLFQGFHALSANPTDRAIRITVRDAGERLAATFRDMAAQLDRLKADLDTQIAEEVAEANRLLAEIAEVHRRILEAHGGPAPNDLLDRRDRLVAELSRVVGVTVGDLPDGTLRLGVAGTGVLLLEGTLVAPLSTNLDVGGDRVDVMASGVTLAPASGALAAALTARNSATGAVKQAAADLDALARAVILEVNRVHATGAGLDGLTQAQAVHAVTSAAVPLGGAGLPFAVRDGAFELVVHDAAGQVVSRLAVAVTAGATTLEDVRAAIDADPDLAAAIVGGRLAISAAGGKSFAVASDTSDALAALGLNAFFAGTDARTMAVGTEVALDPARIAAARVDSQGLVRPGDGDNALALARLAEALTMSGGTATFLDAFGTLLGRVGSQTRQGHETLERQQAVVEQAQALREQTSGVSPDEEMIALMQSQDAFAAAARHVATMREVMQALLDIV
jgi:flagellar hook-associated protein 1 FlgK